MSFSIAPAINLDGDGIERLLRRELTNDIQDVEILSLDVDSVALRFTHGGVPDTLVIDGAEDQIAAAARPFVRLGDFTNDLGIFNFDTQDAFGLGTWRVVSPEFSRIVGFGPDTAPGPVGLLDPLLLSRDEAFDLITEVVLCDGVEGVDLVSIDGDSATVRIDGVSDDLGMIDNVDFSSIADPLFLA